MTKVVKTYIWPYEKRKSMSLGGEQEAFEEIKRCLQKPPVLYMPDNKGKLHLSFKTSKFPTGSVPEHNQLASM